MDAKFVLQLIIRCAVLSLMMAACTSEISSTSTLTPGPADSPTPSEDASLPQIAQAQQSVKPIYDFEDSLMGWTAQDDGKSRACVQVQWSDDKAKDGKYSLKCIMDLLGGDPQKSEGEAWIDMRVNPPSGKTVPADFTNVLVTAWVYAPPGSRGWGMKPNGFQLFVKDDHWNSEYGKWYDVIAGEWMKVTLVVSSSTPQDGFMDQGFDPSHIIAVGVKMGTGHGSREEFRGDIYIDSIDWSTATTTVSTEEAESHSDLLPLDVGNTWVYSKTVLIDRTYLFRTQLELKEGGYVITIGRGGDGPLDCTETYKIVALGEESGVWKIEVSGDPAESCKEAKLRDGRYEGADKVFWREENSYVDPIERFVDEEIYYNREQLVQGWKDQVITEPVESRHFAFIWRDVTEKDQESWTVELSALGEPITTTSSSRIVSVDVPLGHFDDCIEVKDDIAREGGDHNSAWSSGWITRRYFCPRVGLVKESQENRAGQILYSMDLIKYTLSP
jgi:hypothetical protein